MAAIWLALIFIVSMNSAWFGGIAVTFIDQSLPVTHGLPSVHDAVIRCLMMSASSAVIVNASFHTWTGGRPPPRLTSLYSCADRPAETMARKWSMGERPSLQPGGTIHGMWTMREASTD